MQTAGTAGTEPKTTQPGGVGAGGSHHRLAVLRKVRDNDAVSRALDALRAAGAGTDNVLLPMKQALGAHATGGEIAHALRDVWGTYIPNDTF